MNTDTELDKPTRLPLWKACLDDMRAVGVRYGQEFPTEFFEEKLRVKRDTTEFNINVSRIRQQLEFDGFFLSGRGGKGAQFVILQPSANAAVMEGRVRQATKALKRGVILGTNTQTDTLTDSERKRHDGTLERLALRYALNQRPTAVADIVRKKKPDLLKPKTQGNSSGS